MKKIKLSNNEFALIDDGDYNLVSKYKWNPAKGSNGIVYARTGLGGRKNRTGILMHRLLLNYPNSDIDHINSNGLDNRRKNLRICTRSQNMFNQRKTRGNTSYKGVHKINGKNKYIARITINKKTKHLGYFQTKEEAHNVYKQKAIRLNRKIHNKKQGVVFNSSYGKYMAYIKKNQIRYNLGIFNTDIEAARAYNEAAIKYFGEFARLNEL